MDNYKFTGKNRDRMRNNRHESAKERQLREDKKVEEFFSDVKPEKQQINVTVNVDIAKQLKAAYDKVAPRVKKTVQKIPSVHFSKKLMFGCAAIMLSVAALSTVRNDESQEVAFEGATSQEVQGVTVEQEQPDFAYAVPDKDIVPTYDETRKSVSYVDTIGSKRATISQQPIPANELDNELFLLKVAQASNIDKEFPSSSGGVFIGDNREQNVQTAIFKYENNLVFLQIAGIVDPQIIIDYIASLQM